MKTKWTLWTLTKKPGDHSSSSPLAHCPSMSITPICPFCYSTCENSVHNRCVLRSLLCSYMVVFLPVVHEFLVIIRLSSMNEQEKMTPKTLKLSTIPQPLRRRIIIYIITLLKTQLKISFGKK